MRRREKLQTMRRMVQMKGKRCMKKKKENADELGQRKKTNKGMEKIRKRSLFNIMGRRKWKGRDQ